MPIMEFILVFAVVSTMTSLVYMAFGNRLYKKRLEHEQDYWKDDK